MSTEPLKQLCRTLFPKTSLQNALDGFATAYDIAKMKIRLK